MIFIIRESGETRDVNYRDSHGVDGANEIAQNLGLLQNDDVTYDDERDAYVAPREVVEYWQEYFGVTTANDQELSALKNKYSGDEVESLYLEEIGAACSEPDTVSAALATVREILEKRYNLETALFIGEYSPDSPKNDYHYFEESLYWQNTGEFFLAGKGGAMTRYNAILEDGSMCSGARSIPLTKRQAQNWVAEHCDKNTYITLFGT